jgi:hypothetical protein
MGNSIKLASSLVAFALLFGLNTLAFVEVRFVKSSFVEVLL